MTSASEQIATAPVKKTRAKAQPKSDEDSKCGVPGCKDDLTGGAKLRITVLEEASKYPRAVAGRMAVCKDHRKCVGFAGYSPELTQGTKLKPSCGSPAKLVFLGNSYCESCHNVFNDTLLAQFRPKITTEHIQVACAQIFKDNYKEPETQDPVEAQMADLAAQLAALKAKKSAGSKSKKTAAAPAAASAAVAAAPKPRAKKTVAPPPPPPSPKESSQSELEQSDSEAETPVMQVARPPTPMKTMKVPQLDEFEELEQQSKVEKAVAAVAQAASAAPTKVESTKVEVPTPSTKVEVSASKPASKPAKASKAPSAVAKA